jgi:hypothetical protein
VGSIWVNRSSMPSVPNSGAQLDHTAPIDAVAKKATMAGVALVITAATRSPGPTPSPIKAWDSAPTWARSSP